MVTPEVIIYKQHSFLVMVTILTMTQENKNFHPLDSRIPLPSPAMKASPI